MRKIVLLFLFASIIKFSFAARVDTVSIYSEAMHKAFNCVVISPAAKKKLKFPVVYLLHGYSGSYDNWIKRVPQLKNYADQFQTIIVCPDGAFSSWYFDSPIDTSMRYETYISKEVPAYIDSHFHTIQKRNGRAITGLSMGGHGGLFLGFRHTDTFGACGSMSGGVNLYSSRNKYDIAKRIGDTAAFADNWKKYSVINAIDTNPKDSLAIIIDCGVDDFFYADNYQLHTKLLRLKIPHDYIERPGKHDWNYWANAVKYQLLFFKSFFDERLRH